jgi:hypothetical protein
MTEQIVIAVIAPIVTAGVGILALAVGDWRQRRTEAGRRKLAFEDASRQVSFAAEWVNTAKLAASSPEAEQEASARIAVWLEEASGLVAASKPPPVEDRPRITLQRLLLAQPLQSRAARGFRAAFYITLCLVPWVLGLVARDLLDPNSEHLVGLQGDMITLFVVVLLTVGFRVSAERAENARPERKEPHQRVVRRALLFHRFHGPAAKFVRILFYGWILCGVIPAASVLLAELGNPLRIPGSVLFSATFVGYAVALRYWAVSLDERCKETRHEHGWSANRSNGQLPVRVDRRAYGADRYDNRGYLPRLDHGGAAPASRVDLRPGQRNPGLHEGGASQAAETR